MNRQSCKVELLPPFLTSPLPFLPSSFPHSVSLPSSPSSPSTISLNLQIKPGQLVAVVGHVGAGKSSLIQALLGEMDKLSGNVSLKVSSSILVSTKLWGPTLNNSCTLNNSSTV